MSELDPRIGETVEHVQRAALELIKALRTALDVAEDFVADPAAVHTLLQGAVGAARTATETLAAAASSAAAGGATAASGSADASPAGEGVGAERVERIRVE